MKTLKEINECPFCDRASTHEGNNKPHVFKDGLGGYYVKCHNCGTKGPDYEQEDAAVFFWNQIPRRSHYAHLMVAASMDDSIKVVTQ